MRGVEVEAAVYHGFVERTFYRQLAARRTGKGNVGAGKETVDKVEREVVEPRIALETAAVAVEIRALGGQHFRAIGTDERRGVVLAALLGQIDCLNAHIAKGYTLVGKLRHFHRCHGGEALRAAVGKVKVAAEQAREFRHVGQHVGEFRHVHMVKAKGEVVGGVDRLAIEFKARAVVGQQVHIGAYALVAPEVDEVVAIYFEIAEGDDRIFGEEADVHASVGNGGAHAEVHALLALFIEKLEACAHVVAVDEGIEAALEFHGVLLMVVAHEAVEHQAGCVLP